MNKGVYIILYLFFLSAIVLVSNLTRATSQYHWKYVMVKEYFQDQVREIWNEMLSVPNSHSSCN